MLFRSMLASFLTSSASLLAAYSIYNTNFILFCISCLIIGAGVAVTHQYRFAAAEAVGPEKSAKAISFLLLAGIVSGILGPNIANFTKDIVLEHVYVGSYLSLSLLTILPVFLFLFYFDSLNLIIYTKYNHLYLNCILIYHKYYL